MQITENKLELNRTYLYAKGSVSKLRKGTFIKEMSVVYRVKKIIKSTAIEVFQNMS